MLILVDCASRGLLLVISGVFLVSGCRSHVLRNKRVTVATLEKLEVTDFISSNGRRIIVQHFRTLHTTNHNRPCINACSVKLNRCTAGSLKYYNPAYVVYIMQAAVWGAHLGLSLGDSEIALVCCTVAYERHTGLLLIQCEVCDSAFRKCGVFCCLTRPKILGGIAPSSLHHRVIFSILRNRKKYEKYELHIGLHLKSIISRVANSVMG